MRTSRIALWGVLALAGCQNWDVLEGECTVANGCIRTGGAGGSGGPTVPSSPTGVAASVAGVRAVRVTWEAPTNTGGLPITKYAVTVETSSPTAPTRSAQVNGDVLEAVVPDLENGTTYTFVVVARNDVGDGMASTGSNAVTTPAVPAAPTMVVATADLNRQATVTWVAPADVPGYPVTSFRVDGTGVTPQQLDAGTTFALFPGLTNGQQYVFTVVATSAVGGSASANSNPVTPAGKPGAPSGVTATAGNGDAVITWNPPADTGGSPITGYSVTSSPGGIVVSTAGDVLTAHVSGLTNGTPYTFIVVASNVLGAGPGATSNEVTPRAVPDPPTAVTALAGAGSASVSWTAPVNTGGSAITGYTVTSVPGGITVMSATTMAMVTGLTNGTAYQFTVVATNASGNSLPSTPSTPVTPADKPSAPMGVTATPGNAQATVQWLPAMTNGSMITRYTVLAHESGAVVASVNTPDGNLTQATVSGLINNTHTYTFTVTATNAIGTSPESPPSTGVTPQAGLPDSPSNVTATAGDREVSVQWFAPTNNGGSALVSYQVNWSPPTGTGTVTIPSSSTSTTVMNLLNGTTYRFTVQATNASGTGGASPPSNAVTPDTLPGAPGKPSAMPGNGQVTLSWAAPAVNNGTPITSYTVTTTPGGSLNTMSAMTQATVTGLTNGQSYTFTVKATNGAGSGPDSPASDPAIPVSPPATPPANVNASKGTSPDYITVTWSAVAGATDYKVYRGAALIAANVPTVTYNDPGAPEGPSPLIGGLDASVGIQGDTTNRAVQVNLTWNEFTDAGASQSYVVVAHNGGGDSMPSTSSSGYRGAYPITTREVSFNGGAYQTAGTSPWGDTSAPAPWLDAGTATATAGTLLGQVSLTATAAGPYLGATRGYTVRVTNANGRVSLDSNPTSGNRGVGAVSYQWQRTDADLSSSPYSNVPGLTSLTATDVTLPADGAGRWYQCLALASGATSQPTPAVRGAVETLQTPSNFGYQTNGTVYAVATYNGVTYLGGDFTTVAPITGAFAAFVSGAMTPAANPAVERNVLAIVSDGSGGWYIGGDFTFIGGVTRNRVAHLTSAGVLDMAFDPNADGNVQVLLRSGTTLYVGGGFTNIGGQPRSHLAALDTTTGAAISWNPGANDVVRALALTGTTLVVGGDFTTLAGMTRNHGGAVNTSLGTALAFDPNTDLRVRALTTNGTSVWLGGDFTMVRGATARAAAASINLTTNAVNGFDAQLAKAVVGPKVYALALSSSGTTIYIGGDYDTVLGVSQPNMSSVSASSPSTVSSTNDADGPVYAISIGGGSTVFYGGAFSSPHNKFAATGYNVNLNGPAPVYAVAATATNTVAIGGAFGSFGGTARSFGAAFNPDAGLASWNPGADGPIYALQIAGTRMIAGGAFTQRVRAFTLPSGASSGSWYPTMDDGDGNPTDATPNNTVFALGVGATYVYAGGAFSAVSGSTIDGGTHSHTRGRMAAYLIDGGQLGSFNPSSISGGNVYAISVGTSTVYVGGSFTSPRNRAAAVTSTGTTTTWNPNVTGGAAPEVRAIALNGTTAVLGGTFTTVGTSPRANFAVVDAFDAGVLPPNPGTDGTVYAVAPIGNTIYVGGAFSTLGGAPRTGLGSVDLSGAVTPWTPPVLGTVLDLVTTPTTLICGGSFVTTDMKNADVMTLGP